MKTTKISEIQVVPVKPKDGLLGFATLVVDDWLYLSSIAVFSRINGSIRLVYPTKKIGEKSVDIFHPITAEAGQWIEAEVFKKFSQMKGEIYD